LVEVVMSVNHARQHDQVAGVDNLVYRGVVRLTASQYLGDLAVTQNESVYRFPWLRPNPENGLGLLNPDGARGLLHNG
jgi:hypothetical protein